MSPPPIRSRSTVDELDQAAIERERDVLTEKAGQSGKPADDHRQDGRRPACASSTRKSCCSSRPSSSTARPRSSKVVEEAAKEVGAPVKVAGFLRFALGEGIEKKSEDFAAEVAAQLKK